MYVSEQRVSWCQSKYHSIILFDYFMVSMAQSPRKNHEGVHQCFSSFSCSKCQQDDHKRRVGMCTGEPETSLANDIPCDSKQRDWNLNEQPVAAFRCCCVNQFFWLIRSSMGQGCGFVRCWQLRRPAVFLFWTKVSNGIRCLVVVITASIDQWTAVSNN